MSSPEPGWGMQQKKYLQLLAANGLLPALVMGNGPVIYLGAGKK